MQVQDSKRAEITISIVSSVWSKDGWQKAFECLDRTTAYTLKACPSGKGYNLCTKHSKENLRTRCLIYLIVDCNERHDTTKDQSLFLPEPLSICRAHFTYDRLTGSLQEPMSDIICITYLYGKFRLNLLVRYSIAVLIVQYISRGQNGTIFYSLYRKLACLYEVIEPHAVIER